MADDEVVVPELPVGETRQPFIHSGNAAEKALKKAEIERQRRIESQKQRRLQATTVLGDAAAAAEVAALSQALDKKSNEELADLVVRRMAKIALLGGEAFAPTTLREASEAANSWANIAYKEAQKRRATPDTSDEDESPAEQAAKALRQIKSNLKQHKKASGS